MRRLIPAVVAGLAACGGAIAQPARTPLVSELLPSILVAPPGLQRVESKDNSTIRYRISGAFLVVNNSEYDVADVKIQCDWIASSGTRLGTFDITLYSPFAGRGTRNSSAWTEERQPPEQTVAINCAPREFRIVGWRAPPPPPPPVAEAPDRPGGISAGLPDRVACSLVDCPDRAERFVTCDCDLKENLVSWRPNPLYLMPAPPSSPEARRYLRRYWSGY